MQIEFKASRIYRLWIFFYLDLIYLTGDGEPAISGTVASEAEGCKILVCGYKVYIVDSTGLARFGV